jgi:short-subunit dehydrogenase
MNKYSYLILSVSSDIGSELAIKWLKEKKTVIGTYRTYSRKIKDLEILGCKTFKVDFSKTPQISEFISKIKKHNVNKILSAIGSQDPIGNLIDVNFDKWENSIIINAINQIRCIVGLYKKNMGKMKVILFAGGGTNNATESYSAYTLSKIMLIKFAELISFEEEKISCSILGPGWVKTKIHKSTLKNKKAAKQNYIRTIKKLNSEECVPMFKVIECIEWMFGLKKNIIGGRNISLVYDNWNSKKLEKMLKKDSDMYKLRRYKNTAYVRKKIINEINYGEKNF